MSNQKDLLCTNLRFPRPLVDELDKFSKTLGISRTQLIINLLNSGVDDLKLLNSCGLLVVGKGLRELVDKVRHGETLKGEQTQLPL